MSKITHNPGHRDRLRAGAVAPGAGDGDGDGVAGRVRRQHGLPDPRPCGVAVAASLEECGRNSQSQAKVDNIDTVEAPEIREIREIR